MNVKLNNGILMPKFGLGTFKIGLDDNTYQVISEAIKMGYRHFDTAMMYRNEEEIGQAINDSNVDRKDIFVTTKIVKLHNGDKNLIREEVQGCFKRLNLEYIDLLLIHWPSQDKSINKNAYEVLEEFYNKGMLKAIGVSNFKKHHMEDLLKTVKVYPQVNQIESHPLFNQEDMRLYLKEKNVQMISYGPFARGRAFQSPLSDQLQVIADKYNASISQVIISWQLSRDIVMIPKTVHIDRLATNMEGTKLVLKEEDIIKINNLNQDIRLYTDPDLNDYT